MKKHSSYTSTSTSTITKSNMDAKLMKQDVSSSITNEILQQYESSKDDDKSKPAQQQQQQPLSIVVKTFNSFKGGKTKLIAFDLDDTLIRPKDKKRFGKDADNWELMFDKEIMRSKIEQYVDLKEDKNEYLIAVLSNQHGIETGHTTEEIVLDKVTQVFTKELKYPLVFICAKSKDYYRKPYPGMIEYIEMTYNNGVRFNRKDSLYVGNAAGRKKSKQRSHADHSDSDYKLALNAGMRFSTPEEFFLGTKQSVPAVEFDLHVYDSNDNSHVVFDGKTQEMIIMVGSPGSGKSSYCENVLVKLHKYVRVNRDDLKTEKKCIDVAETAIQRKQSVVIDNTNPKASNRAVYIKLAKKHHIQVRCFVMNVPKELAFHLNNLRFINNERTHYSQGVNAIPIHSFYKYYEHPSAVDEGIDAIISINFIPGPFVSEKEKEIFYMVS